MSRFQLSFISLALLLSFSLFSQEGEKSEEIQIELTVEIVDKDGNPIVYPPVISDLKFAGYFNEHFEGSRRRNARSLYVRLAIPETKKLGIMDLDVYEKLKSSGEKPNDSHFRMKPYFDKLKMERGGFLMGQINGKKYIFNNQFERISQHPTTAYKVLTMEKLNESLIKLYDLEGGHFYNTKGKKLTAKGYKNLELRGDFLQCQNFDRTVEVLDLQGKVVIPAFKSGDCYISPEGVITLGSDRQDLVTYIDLRTADTIAQAPKGYRHRGDFAAIKRQQYWELIDRKGKLVKTPFEEIERVQLFDLNTLAILTRGNPGPGNRFLYSIFNLETEKGGVINVPTAYNDYILESGTNRSLKFAGLLQVNVKEKAGDWKTKFVPPERVHRAFVSMTGEFFPKKGKYQYLRLLRPKGHENLLSIGKYNGLDDKRRVSYLYGLSTMDGDILIAPGYDQVSLVRQGIKVKKGDKFGLFDLNGKVLIPANKTSRDYYESLKALKK